MNTLADLIAHHLTAAGFGGGALLIAAICTMPAIYPKTFQEMWTWMRDALQTVVPAARHPRGQEAHIITSQETAAGASSKSDATFPVATSTESKGAL